MREQFEKLPEIAARLSEYKIVFHGNDYAAQGYSDNTKLWIALGFVNGAWYAFQEQQKKINKVFHYLDCASNPLDIEIDDIREILK